MKKLFYFLSITLIAFITISNLWLAQFDKYTYSDSHAIPKAYACLVLGASKSLADGRVNLFFKKRIEAAVTLYQANKCQKLIVSGDNAISSYNEPNDMKNALLEKGVLLSDIICDYAGRRTMDSVIRFKEIFGQNSGIVISQKFHNERAIFIAKQNAIDLVGFNADEVDAYNSFKTKFRELFSKTKAVLDAYILHSKPKILGDKISI